MAEFTTPLDAVSHRSNLKVEVIFGDAGLADEALKLSGLRQRHPKGNGVKLWCPAPNETATSKLHDRIISYLDAYDYLEWDLLDACVSCTLEAARQHRVWRVFSQSTAAQFIQPILESLTGSSRDPINRIDCDPVL